MSSRATQSNLVVLRQAEPSPVRKTILQADLIQLMFLKRKFNEAKWEKERKEEQVRSALEAGADVERGLHNASLVEVHREGFQVTASSQWRLVVK